VDLYVKALAQNPNDLRAGKTGKVQSASTFTSWLAWKLFSILPWPWLTLMMAEDLQNGCWN
jgi:hypothetical protein